MATITAANAVIMFSIPGLFPTPQQLQGFAADDITDTDALESAEVLMGVDGVLSGGFVYVAVKQNYALQADSPSAQIFDQWYATQQQIQDLYTAQATLLYPSIGTKWAMTKGFLTSYMPIPAAKKLLQPRKFTVTWQSISPAPQ
jgi:hypothetical protein